MSGSSCEAAFEVAAGAPKSGTASPFSIRLTPEERARLSEEAGSEPLGTYIRARLLGEKAEKRRRARRPGADHKALALVLAELGRSHLASNMNQLARAANTGTLDLGPDLTRDLREACWNIAVMRETLVRALGVKPEGGR